MHLHFLRMRHHGFGPQEIVRLLSRKAQHDVAGLIHWYDEAAKIARSRLAKPDATIIGDKSPDFFLSRPLIAELLAQHRLLYLRCTVPPIIRLTGDSLSCTL